MGSCISCGKRVFVVLGAKRKIAKIASDDRRHNKQLEEGIRRDIVDTTSNDCRYNIQSE